MSASISSASGFNPAAMMQRMGGAGGIGGMKGMQPPKEMQQQIEAQFKKAADAAGVDSSQFAEMGGKIQDALKNVDLSASDDPQATIESTINSVLQENGIDAEQFKADFQKVMDKMPKPDFAKMSAGFGGVSGSGGTYSASSSQQDQLQKLLDQLFKDNDENQNSQIASFFSQASSGTFLDTAA